MYNQGVIPLAARPRADRRAWIGWTLCSLFPAVFLLFLFALTLFSAPEHDDFCFADLYARHGFVDTVSLFYHSQSGRVLALWLTQVPPAISAAAGVSLLSAYSLTMARGAVSGRHCPGHGPCLALHRRSPNDISHICICERRRQRGSERTGSAVRPSLLMEEELKERPGRLPNDCVAAF